MANEKRLDLIDRQALGIGRCDPDAFPIQNRGYCAGWNGVINLLEQAPRVDAVEVVHGVWVEVGDGVFIGKGTHFECSACRTWTDWGQLSNYCPNCGAKMNRGEET